MKVFCQECGEGIKHKKSSKDILRDHHPEVGLVIPDKEVLIFGNGTHSGLATAYFEVYPEEDLDNYPPYVAFFVSPAKNILLRWDYQSPNLELIWRADKLLQKAGLEAERVKFLYNRELFHGLGLSGEKWRLHIDTKKSTREIKEIIQKRVPFHKGSALRCHYNPCNGNRVITFNELKEFLTECLEKGDDVFTENFQLVLRLMKEKNMRHKPELQIFKALDKKLTEALRYFTEDVIKESLELPEKLCSDFLESIRCCLEREFFSFDDFDNSDFYNLLYCRLEGISREHHESDLAKEFLFNLRWMTGGQKINGRFKTNNTNNIYYKFEKEIINHFRVKLLPERHDIKAYNLGVLLHSQSLRNRRVSGGRKVMIMELVLSYGVRTFLVRLVKWGVQFRRTQEHKNMDEAVSAYDDYLNYIFDRQRALHLLKFNVPLLSYFEEHVAGFPRGYICREYIHGVSVDKLTAGRLKRPGFMEKLMKMLGRATAENIIIGRASNENNKIHFCDGDEIILVDENGKPYDYILADFTGAFYDFSTPLPEFAPQYREVIFDLIRKSCYEKDMSNLIIPYRNSFLKRFRNIQGSAETMLNRDIFRFERGSEGSFSYRWNATLKRALSTDAVSLLDSICDGMDRLGNKS